MTADGFTRPVETVDQALVIAASRRTLAVQNRDNAIAAAAKADSDVLIYERHIEMCDRAITGLLDERLRALADEDAAEVERMVSQD